LIPIRLFQLLDRRLEALRIDEAICMSFCALNVRA